MENKKMWQALIRQMIIEFALLTLFYLFVGNNFGNNIQVQIYEKLCEIFSKIEEWWFEIPSIVLFQYFTYAIGFFLAIPPSIIILLVAFSPFWIPLAIVFFTCLDGLRISMVKTFAGKPLAVAIPAIQEWYKNKQKIYITFVIVSRILFFVLLLFKAKNTPDHYILDCALAGKLKWEMENGLIGKLIIIIGAVLLFVSACIRIKFFVDSKTYSFDKYICPKCHCMGTKKVIKKEQLKEAVYDSYETSSGYYAPEKTGELRDSAGNTVGDVYEDTWHDTSRVRSTMVSPATWEYTYEWKPCHCIEHKKVEKRH